MCRPSKDAKPGSLHNLSSYGGLTKIFEWTGEGWGSPKTGWQTPYKAMGILGWKYDSPIQEIKS
jgi:hypothetical protein